jgi:hypothetical protein
MLICRQQNAGQNKRKIIYVIDALKMWQIPITCGRHQQIGIGCIKKSGAVSIWWNAVVLFGQEFLVVSSVELYKTVILLVAWYRC